ncbi:hypothetical protein D3C75_626500 [compost metagenome]
MGDEGHQHLVFGLGQAYRHPVLAELAAGNIEAPGAEIDSVVEGFGDPGGSRRQRDPPQQVLDPHQQLPQLERLGDIVIGSHLQADYPVHRIAAAGDQNDPDSAARPQLAGQQQAILPRQVDVQHHQIHLLLCQHGAHLQAVFHRRHPIALPLEIAGQLLAGHRIIFNNQNVVAHGQGSRRSTREDYSIHILS